MRSKSKQSPVSKNILRLVADNTGRALSIVSDLLFGHKANESKNRFAKSYIKRRFNQLIKQGLIKLEKEDGKNYVRLTTRGERKLAQYELGEIEIKKPKRWDGKWRVVIFDIRENRRGVRDTFRTRLQELGLVRLQNSVWVHSYDFSEVIVLAKADFMIGKDILYLIVEEIENDRWLREHFDL